MREKKLILYLRDEEYGKRLLRFLNGRRHPLLRPMMVTDREEFWRSREEHERTEDICYLTDDVSGELTNPGGAVLLWLVEVTDLERHRIGICQKADRLYADLLQGIGLPGEEDRPSGAPPPGVYGIYSPGEEGSVAAALLSQELGSYGSCLYVNFREFPCFYTAEREEHTEHLGELFFRLDSSGYDDLVKRVSVAYGAAMRLPTVAHYRDLWDIGERDREHFYRRLQQECGLSYIVVLCADVREAIPLAETATRFLVVTRAGRGDAVFRRWQRYVKTEKAEQAAQVIRIELPDSVRNWIRDMEEQTPESWLQDAEKKNAARMFLDI